MNSVASVDYQANNSVNTNIPISANGKGQTWEVARPPRLRSSDLEDPTRFHRRLVKWLMEQK